MIDNDPEPVARANEGRTRASAGVRAVSETNTSRIGTNDISTSEGNTGTAVVCLGAAPADEPRTGGDPLRLALTDRLAVRRVVGDEPDGARLLILRTPRTWPDPVQVACEYDPTDPPAAASAERCRACAPSTRAAAGMDAPDDGAARGRA